MYPQVDFTATSDMTHSAVLDVVSPQILTPWREPPAPDKEAFMTFWVTRDALVHVCVDSRTPRKKLPSWLEYAGFRKIPVGVRNLSTGSLFGAFTSIVRICLS